MVEKLKGIVEAILYVAGRPVEISRIHRALKKFLPSIDIEDIRRAILQLMDDLRSSDSALEILHLPGDRFVLQLRSEYSDIAKLFSFTPPIGKGLLKTLSYIALNQPVALSQVAKVRGSSAYRHVRELKRMKLISSERKGKENILYTSASFNEMMGLSGSPSEVAEILKKLFASKHEEYTLRLPGLS
ncbi:MAG: SMC-Scp complex subunit ScpB [Nitrososphaerota archaeon]|nr:SMC-Scp complex subunit ScpB [Candidatus Bathyarchaeota archaeon]MCX8162774.1 SMC-Scp complex subunit ScpB [Candidatus Bathyarchaeota archaeon]MDW8061402.1 SMC-Scp complex subunit ScpB [Nitrososphaerota archaeon]